MYKKSNLICFFTTLIFLILIMIFPKLVNPLFAQSFELVPQIGHHKTVNCMIFSPDSTYLVSAGDDCTIKIWEVETGFLIRTLENNKRPILALCFFPEGNKLYSGDKNGWLTEWNFPSGELIKNIQGPKEGIYSLACSPNGKILCIGSGYGAVQLWNRENLTKKIELQGIVRLVGKTAFTPDGKKLAFTIGNFALNLWDMETGTSLHLFGGHEDEIYAMSISPNGKYIATGGIDGQLLVWDIQERSLKQKWGVGATIYSIQFADVEKLIYVGTENGNVRTYQIGELNLVNEIHAAKKPIHALSLQNKTLIIGDASGNIVKMHTEKKDIKHEFGFRLKESTSLFQIPKLNWLGFNHNNMISIFNWKTGKIEHSCKLSSSFITYIAINHDGKYLACSDTKGSIYLMNLNLKTEKKIFDKMIIVSALAFHPTRPILAIGNKKGIVEIIDVETGKSVLSKKIHQRAVNDLLFHSATNSIVTAGRDKKIIITSFENLDVQQEFIHDIYNFTDLCFTNDGSSLISGTAQGMLLEFEFPSLELQFEEKPHNYSINSIDYFENMLVVNSLDKSITIWNWRDHMLKKRFDAGTVRINHLGIFDNDKLAVVGENGLLKCYNLNTGTWIGTLAIPSSEAWCLWYSDNRFAGNGEGLNFLRVNIHNQSKSVTNFADTHFIGNVIKFAK